MIKIIDFLNVEINGINVGDCFAAYSNYPEQAMELLSALSDYDRDRQSTIEPIIVSDPRVATLEQQLSAAQSQNILLERQLSQYVIKDWEGLIAGLKDAGFYDWAAQAIAQDANLIDEVAELRSAAQDKDVARLVANFRAIASIHRPIKTMLGQWQAVLDAAGIPKNLMAFAR
jgi:hypothetical protein